MLWDPEMVQSCPVSNVMKKTSSSAFFLKPQSWEPCNYLLTELPVLFFKCLAPCNCRKSQKHYSSAHYSFKTTPLETTVHRRSFLKKYPTLRAVCPEFSATSTEHRPPRCTSTAWGDGHGRAASAGTSCEAEGPGRDIKPLPQGTAILRKERPRPHAKYDHKHPRSKQGSELKPPNKKCSALQPSCKPFPELPVELLLSEPRTRSHPWLSQSTQ